MANLFIFLLDKTAELVVFLDKKMHRCLVYTFGLFFIMRDFLNRNKTKHDFIQRRDGHVAIVTGGGRGLGQYVVRGFLKCGVHVVIAVRQPKKCQTFLEKLKEENYDGTFELMTLDTSSLKSVEAFVKTFNSKFKVLNYLVNNAAISIDNVYRSVDGFDIHMATNYLGHFYLTHLLMDPLRDGAVASKQHSRIVNVSSMTHLIASMFYEGFNPKMMRHRDAAYGESKLAQVMSTKYLSEAFKANDLPIDIFSCHPGSVDTGMSDDLRNNLFASFTLKLFKTPEEGAETILYACLSPDLEGKGGKYLVDCSEAHSSSVSKNVNEQLLLFKASCDASGISEFNLLKNETR